LSLLLWAPWHALVLYELQEEGKRNTFLERSVEPGRAPSLGSLVLLLKTSSTMMVVWRSEPEEREYAASKKSL
jgi:hypothetical protein